MDSVLVDPEFMNKIFKFNPELLSTFLMNQNGGIQGAMIKHPDFSESSSTFDFVDDPPQTETYSFNPNLENNYNNSSSCQEVPDFPDDCLKFISDILLEEDLEHTPASEQDFTALQETEKSLYDALGLSQPYPSSYSTSPSNSDTDPSFESFVNQPQINSSLTVDDISASFSEINPPSSGSKSNDSRLKNKSNNKPSRKKRTRQKDDQARNHKVQATSNEDYVEMEQFDDVILLCNIKDKSPADDDAPGSKTSQAKRRTDRSKSGEPEVDLITLLNQCAQAVSSFDLRSANELLKQIRQHTSPYGDSTQRTAHQFANALEARLAGTGSTFSANLIDVRISSADFFRAYRRYVSAIPFKRMSFFFANNVIREAAEKATKIHIIDFGVFLGLQWPCLIQALSKRPNGPPNLRITGIEYPQQGFRPAERVEATGRRLSGYCKRFGVPFQYQAIAQKWETIQPEDLKIETDELVIINCIFRSGTLLDETVDQANSPKDAFLRLVRQLKPNLFIHGIVNGSFNAPFFVTRFKEALFHYSSIFDMFDATIPREAHERLLVESEYWGKEVINVIACEGAERLQRPETYKQWQVRTARAGLRQLALNQELMSKAKATVKANYHKDFMVDQDKHWMLQGWKGRIICALSFWQPA